MITINNLTFHYGRNTKDVLRNINLNIEEGGIYGLLGPNGAGKSTLLYLLSGLLTPTSGNISVNGLNPRNREVAFLNDIFLVPEEFSLPPVSLESYIEVNAPFYPRFDREAMKRSLEIFGMEGDIHLGRLSMGQKKRVFMSFALACNTSVLLLDEPTNGLDIPGKRLFRQAIIESMTDNRAVIISTHQVLDIEKILDHVVITRDSGVKLDGKISEITSKLRFRFTDNRAEIDNALLSLPAPGGANIVEIATPSDGGETDINLESLFELAMERPDVIARLFNNPNS